MVQCSKSMTIHSFFGECTLLPHSLLWSSATHIQLFAHIIIWLCHAAAIVCLSMICSNLALCCTSTSTYFNCMHACLPFPELFDYDLLYCPYVTWSFAKYISVFAVMRMLYAWFPVKSKVLQQIFIVMRILYSRIHLIMFLTFHNLLFADAGFHSSKVGCTGALGRRIPKKNYTEQCVLAHWR